MRLIDAIEINQSKYKDNCNKCNHQSKCNNCVVKNYYILVDDVLKKAEKYKWHLLAENENDLPDMGVGVETIILNTNTGETFYDHNWTIPGGKWAKVGNSANVLKWRYIDNE